MSIRKLIFGIVLGAGVFAGNAEAFDWYRIIDYNGNTISQSLSDAPWPQASFTADGCGLVQRGNAMVVQCYGNQFVDSPFFQSYSTGVRGCTNQPYPFIEYPEASLCYTMTYNVNYSTPYPAGLPRCAPGAAGYDANGALCVRPFVFRAAPTAPGGLHAGQWIIAFGSSGGPVSACVEPAGSTVCTVYPPADGVTYPFPYVTLVYNPAYTCRGFQSPLDKAISLKKSNRAIPLKAQIFDTSNALVTPATLNGTPPVVEVTYSSGTSTAIDVTSSLVASGQSSVGNQFSFDSATGTWWFNLDSGPYTAPGIYTINLVSGDGTKYGVTADCSGTFVRQ